MGNANGLAFSLPLSQSLCCYLWHDVLQITIVNLRTCHHLLRQSLSASVRLLLTHHSCFTALTPHHSLRPTPHPTAHLSQQRKTKLGNSSLSWLEKDSWGWE